MSFVGQPYHKSNSSSSSNKYLLTAGNYKSASGQLQNNTVNGVMSISINRVITHEIYKSLDDGFEVRSVILNIYKAFDKVSDQGIVFKLRQSGISGDQVNILFDFLSNRKQRVVLNGQTSSWAIIISGIPQGSILDPLLFLININNLPDDFTSIVKLFADDTCLFSAVHEISASAKELNEDLNKINNWAF